MPCDCCAFGEEQCGQVEQLFDGNGGSAILVSAGTSTGTYPLDRWSNGDVSGGAFTGFNSPGVQFTAATSPVVDLVFNTPQNRVYGIREWNQGGGDLGDSDGFASWDMEFFAGAVSLGVFNMTMGNGGAPFTFTLPGGLELNGVTRVRLSNMRKLNPGAGVSPLTREVRALKVAPVYPCRRPSGTVEWYDEAGNLVPSAGVTTCDGLAVGTAQPVPPADPVPFVIPDLRLVGGAFGDDPGGVAENLCNVVPTPSATTGWAAPVSGCYDPVVGNPTMTWTSLQTVEMTYDENAANSGASGGVNIGFSSPALGETITWPATGNMAPGQQLWSNPFGGGRQARLTYVSGPTPPANNTISVIAGINNLLQVHSGAVANLAGIRFRLEFFTP